MKLIPILLAALLSGCATSPWGDVNSGGAVYDYTRTAPDGSRIEIHITSSREVGEAALVIDKDGGLSTEASTLGGTDAAMLTIQALVEALIGKP